MRASLIFPATRIWILALALLLPPAQSYADPIRVTTWDLQPGPAAGTNVLSHEFQQNLATQAAEALRKLRPDVILLQQVAGWETCLQIAQALKPETYHIAICSSFRDPLNKISGGQVAILSKAKSYLAWSEPWRIGGPSQGEQGGFAFAAIQLGGKNIGFFSIQLSDGGIGLRKARDESASQLLKQIDALHNWSVNRLQAIIVAGHFGETPGDLRLEQIGFDNAFAGAATLDSILTRDAGRVDSPRMTQIALCEHEAVTCEMDLTAPKALPARPPPAALANATRPQNNLQSLSWLAGGLVIGLAFLVLARKLARRPELTATTLVSIAPPPADQIIVARPPQSRPYVHIETEGSTQTQSQSWRPPPEAGCVSAPMPAAVRAGVIANLSRWLKQKMVQRLVSDRAQLLATQQAAARKLQTVDQRLAKVERQIRQINQQYEQRIDALLNELDTAKEENRELIRDKIALVKAEMEKAQRDAGAPTKEHQQS